MIKFNDEFYKNLILRYNYNPLDFAPMDFNFHQIPANVMNCKWLCHSGIDCEIGKRTIVTSGIGLSGNPHMGTLSQIMRLIFLQKNGLNVQMVLGDLDSYNARNQSLSVVLERAEQYKLFIKKLGFDAEKGILRSQYDYNEILKTQYLISKYVDDIDFFEAEEDLSELYIKENIYKGITFPVKQAILLMIADFIHLGINDEYNNIIVMLGLEEHLYVLLARKIIERMQLKNVRISGLYSRLIKGLRGYPKMSKSIKGSAITVDMSADEIRNIILSEDDNYITPLDSVVFQLMSSVSEYTIGELDQIYKDCGEKNHIWQEHKKRYVDMLVSICSLWEK